MEVVVVVDIWNLSKLKTAQRKQGRTTGGDGQKFSLQAQAHYRRAGCFQRRFKYIGNILKGQ